MSTIVEKYPRKQRRSPEDLGNAKVFMFPSLSLGFPIAAKHISHGLDKKSIIISQYNYTQGNMKAHFMNAHKFPSGLLQNLWP